MSPSFQRKILIGSVLAFFLVNAYVMLNINGINIVASIQNAYFSFSNIISKKPTCKDCNIILISLDTLGANHLPCYGHTRNTSPNLCKFGQDNILVQDMSANSSYTLSSHVSIFTGLYPREHEVNIPNVDRLDKKIPLLPQELKKNGYETYFCMTTLDPHLPIDKVYNRGIDRIYETFELEGWDHCLSKLKENNKKNKKTFIFLHIYKVHAPYLVSSKRVDLSKLETTKIPEIPETIEDLMMMKYEDEFFPFFIKKLDEDLRNEFWGNDKKTVEHYTNMLSLLKKLTSQKEKYSFLDDIHNKYIVDEYLGAFYFYKTNLLPSRQVKRLSDIYDIAITELDASLGKILDSLSENTLWNNTVIAITSDHGEEFMEHEKVVGHGANLYNTTTKVPLIMRVPNIHKRRVTVPAESVDIFPTLLDIVGIKNTLSFSGSNIFGVKNGIQKSDLFYNDYYVRTIRDKDWKLIIKKESRSYSARELYNISIDPDEKNNLIFKNPSKVNALLRIFRDNEFRILEKQSAPLKGYQILFD